MASLKQFWLITALVTSVIFALIAFALWQPSFSFLSTTDKAVATDTLALEKEQGVAAIANQTDSQATPAPDPSLPAPAKKLHKLINDPEFQPLSDTELEQRIQQAEQQLQAINQQLQQQGITLPQNNNEASESANLATNETAARLQAIKDYMEKRASP